jgi:hypothetical protein
MGAYYLHCPSIFGGRTGFFRRTDLMIENTERTAQPDITFPRKNLRQVVKCINCDP